MNQTLRSTAEFLGSNTRNSFISYKSVEVVAALVDACLILLAGLSGFTTYRFISTGHVSLVEGSVGIGISGALLFTTLSACARLYRMEAILNPSRFARQNALTFGLAMLCLASVIFLLKVGDEYSRGNVISFACYGVAFIFISRYPLCWICAAAMKRGLLRGRRAITVGVASELERMAPQDLRRFGIEEIARIGVLHGEPSKGLGEHGRARIAQTIELARDLRAAEFVLMIPWNWDRVLAEVGDLLRISPLSVRLLPDTNVRSVLATQRHQSLDLELAVELQREPLSRAERLIKRSIDVSLSLIALVLLSPVLILTAVAIKSDSRGPVLFRQRRVGFDNAEFVIFKFRSMTALDDGADVVQARRGDQRVTRVGRILRRTSIDELPQLLNVLRGDMSLVGPRPHARAHHDKYCVQIAKYAFRHHVKPGLTGMAQVQGLRGETPQLAQMERRVEQDIWYINHWSLRLDLAIMARTCVALVRNDVY